MIENNASGRTDTTSRWNCFMKDAGTLNELYTFIHAVVDESPMIRIENGYMLAYDIRKAQESCQPDESCQLAVVVNGADPEGDTHKNTVGYITEHAWFSIRC